uniref:Uncharacterized protein n=1 Tax=Mycena chlorophos TaxID=658473 RepID=A0ABQ0L528_MYCCL|nr:predicted protein [Mycena chlorophos]
MAAPAILELGSSDDEQPSLVIELTDSEDESRPAKPSFIDLSMDDSSSDEDSPPTALEYLEQRSSFVVNRVLFCVFAHPRQSVRRALPLTRHHLMGYALYALRMRDHARQTPERVPDLRHPVSELGNIIRFDVPPPRIDKIVSLIDRAASYIWEGVPDCTPIQPVVTGNPDVDWVPVS